MILVKTMFLNCEKNILTYFIIIIYFHDYRIRQLPRLDYFVQDNIMDVKSHKGMMGISVL